MTTSQTDEYITVTCLECGTPQTLIVNGLMRFCCGKKLAGSNKQPRK